MIPDNLIFLQAVPIDQYFNWQLEVQIVNFRKFGISDRMQICVWYPIHRTGEMEMWKEIQEKYPEVKFFFYRDSGVDLGLYISQLRPHILYKHFVAKEEELKNKVFFYHDSDIIFNYLPNFEKLCSDNICWQSDTSSYLDYSYIIRKEKQGNIPNNEALRKLAEIGGITPLIIEQYDKNTGGAQSILKNIDAEYWRDVENISVEIRKAFLYGREDTINTKYFKSEAEGFQSWVADMWALDFSLWKRGIPTNTTSELDFSWATDSMETYLKKPIFHNAGAVGTSKDIFYKGAYINKSPLYQDLPLPSEDRASRMYVLAINEVKNNV
jgi:hypothetical protein